MGVKNHGSRILSIVLHCRDVVPFVYATSRALPLSGPFGEIWCCILAKQLNGGSIVCESSLKLSSVTAVGMANAIALHASHPRVMSTGFAVSYSLVLRYSGSLFSIPLILLVSADAKILAAIVEGVSIDMVNVHTFRAIGSYP